MTAAIVYVFDAGNNFCSPQKERHSGMAGENVTVNGNQYPAECTQNAHNVYVSSGDLNGSHADDRLSHQAIVNSTDEMPALCRLGELEMTTGQQQPPDDCNAKHVVKSLLRAMLAKPRATDITSLIEMTTKTENFDSGSDDTLEQSVGGDGRDDDSQSAAEVVAREDTIAREDEVPREDATMMESETDLPASGPNWASSAVSSPEKASRCPYCLKMFRYRSSYRRHVKIHEGIFSHECSVCERKFTRKEHFVRHKCDRRPNKPYNVTHEAFRRMSPSQKAAARYAVKSVIGRDALAHLGVNNDQLEAPLELTCQSIGKQQLDVPKLLFTGGTVQPGLVDCKTYQLGSATSVQPGSVHSNTYPIGSMPSTSSVQPGSWDCNTYPMGSVSSTQPRSQDGNTYPMTSAIKLESVEANTYPISFVSSVKTESSYSMSQLSSMQPALLDCSPSVVSGGGGTADGCSENIAPPSVRLLDVVSHNESRRKSSTPRKVVTTTSADNDTNGTIDNYSTGDTVARLTNHSSVPLSVIE